MLLTFSIVFAIPSAVPTTAMMLAASERASAIAEVELLMWSEEVSSVFYIDKVSTGIARKNILSGFLNMDLEEVKSLRVTLLRL